MYVRVGQSHQCPKMLVTPLDGGGGGRRGRPPAVYAGFVV